DTRKITDINIRKAIAIAYPYDAAYKASGLSPLTDIPASTILAPSVPGYTAYTPFEGLTGKGAGDPAKAKSILQSANALGYELSWYYNNASDVAAQVLAVRKKAFEDAGFKVNAIGVSPQELRAKRGDYSAPVNLFQTGSAWCSDWPTGGSWFPVLFES